MSIVALKLLLTAAILHWDAITCLLHYSARSERLRLTAFLTVEFQESIKCLQDRHKMYKNWKLPPWDSPVSQNDLTNFFFFTLKSKASDGRLSKSFVLAILVIMVLQISYVICLSSKNPSNWYRKVFEITLL